MEMPRAAPIVSFQTLAQSGKVAAQRPAHSGRIFSTAIFGHEGLVGLADRDEGQVVAV
jgi:hypothetical protein